jgi:hypothetical protein
VITFQKGVRGNGISKHPLYGVWQQLIQRCTNQKNKDFRFYGGRGISVCDEWRSDSNVFLRWADSSGYEPGLTIDRIDTNGNYEPSNCRWIDRASQSRNRRVAKRITFSSPFRGVAKCNSGRPWKVCIDKKTYIGKYSTAIEAAIAYDDASFDKYGELRRLNFPERKRSLVS